MQTFLFYRLTYIGDVLMLTALISSLKKIYPDSKIGFVVGPEAAPMLENNPDIDQVYIFDRKGRHQSWLARWELRKKIYQDGFNVTYVMNRSFSSALYCFFLGSTVRIGFATEGRNFLLTKSVPYDKEKNEYDCFYDILDSVVSVERQYQPRLVLTGQEKASAANIAIDAGLQLGEAYITFHMVTHPAKTWAVDNFIELAKHLLSTNTDSKLVLLGGRDNVNAAKAVCSALSSSRLIDLTSKLSLRQTAAVISQADLFIGVDSSLAHMAAAFQIPSVVLFGATSAKKWGYNDKKRIDIEGIRPCTHCSRRTCRKSLCMDTIKVSAVAEQVDLFLGSHHCVRHEVSKEQKKPNLQLR